MLSTFEIFYRGLMATSFSRLVVQLLEPTFEGWRKKSPNYCWWKKSETTNPVNNGIFTISTGEFAGFLPSTVADKSVWVVGLFWTPKVMTFVARWWGSKEFLLRETILFEMYFIQRLKPPGLRWFFFVNSILSPKTHILLKTLHSS